jgi:hypothetical protein
MEFFGEYTSFYFYSTLFQGNMALLALGGVFVVYRMQIHTTMIAAHDAEIVRIAERYYHGELPQFVSEALLNPSTFLSQIESWHKERGEEHSYSHETRKLIRDPQLKQLSIARDHSIAIQENIRRKFRPPLAMILILTFCSLLVLPFCASIHCVSQWLEAGMFLIATAFEAIALKRTWELILELIE